MPYVNGEEQFAHTVDWFEGQRPPEALIFADDRGVATLTGLRWRGHTGGTYAVGRLTPSVTYAGRPRRLKNSYRLRSFTSQIDGLQEFANFGAVTVNESRTRADTLTATLEPPERFRWRHAGYTHEIRVGAVWSARFGQSFSANSEAFLSNDQNLWMALGLVT